MEFHVSYWLMAYLAAGFPGPAMIDQSDLVPIVVIPSLCLMIGWLVWMLTRTAHLKTQARIDLQRRFLEKLNSAQEVVALMQTEEGRRFLGTLSIEQTTHLEQIFATVQKGVILTVAGLGALSLRLFVPSGFGVFIIIGVFVGATGLGFLVSAAVAYRLSKSWDLLETKKAPSDRRDGSLFR